MERTNENRTAGNRARVASTVAILLCLGLLASGCSVIDSIDRQLARWGVVDRYASAVIDPLAVVEIVSGKAKGVGVSLEGGLVFTANHVVRGREKVLIRTFGYDRSTYYQALEARVVFRDPSSDQALLAVVDTEKIGRTVALGRAVPGRASVIPLRASGRSAFGEVVNYPVRRDVTITKEKDRIRGEARLAKGDSGSPVVQDGKVVGLVRGATRMIAPDVMAKYEHLLKALERRSSTGQGNGTGSVSGGKLPECSGRTTGGNRF